MRAKGSRRRFLADVGSGMLVACVGHELALDLGFTRALGDEPAERLTFGALEPLVSLMQETSADQLVPALVDRLKAGTSLRELVAAGALANARTFGGEDYVGFHTMMAMAPAYHMSAELPEERRPLPVLKVLYRNTNRIQESGQRKAEVLRQVEPLCCLPEDHSPGELLQQAVREKNLKGAESAFATIAQDSPEAAFNAVLFAVQDNTEVHRTVLPYRAWDLLGIIGMEQAHTLLRQSLHYCVKSERDWGHNPEIDRPRTLLPKLLESYHLIAKPLGDRQVDDTWVEHMSKTIFEGTPDHAADAVASALAEGIAPAAIGESVALAANQLILRDAGRTQREVQPGKPLGSVHGDSIGVHACDSANAWRNMARVASARNTAACLILGAYQVAYDRVNRGGDFLHWQPHPVAAEAEPIHLASGEALLKETETAIKANDQFRACALVNQYGKLDLAARPLFDLLIKYAISEDGALHAEKFYRTVSEEYATARPAFRWRQLVALARVTASEYGKPAPGVADACERLSV